MKIDQDIVQPHEEAEKLIRQKRPVSREVFYGLLPELRGRAFAVSGIEGARVLQGIRDSIAGLARGVGDDGKPRTWDVVKREVVDQLGELGAGAEARATVLIRTHGFQAFQSHNWRVAQEDADTTHLQYLATEDERVRDSHLALNGIVLPKDDPFWDTHMPPWEWNCRCRVRAMNPDMVAMEREADATRAPEDRNVMEGPALEQLRSGTLLRESRRFDVTPPRDKMGSGGAPFEWHPDDLRMSVGDIEQRYDPEVVQGFESWARKVQVGKDVTVWNWLMSKPRKLSRGERMRLDRARSPSTGSGQAAQAGEQDKGVERWG